MLLTHASPVAAGGPSPGGKTAHADAGTRTYAMCGIVGAVGLGRPIDLAALQRMNDLQAHRGPDGEGFFVGWVSAGQFQHTFLPHTKHGDVDTPVTVGLGHRRLAILDLSDRGLQPMTV